MLDNEKLLNAELELEHETIMQARQALQKSLELSKDKGTQGDGTLANKFTGYAWADCLNNVNLLINKAQHPDKTVQGDWLRPLQDCIEVFENLRGKELAENDLGELLTLQTMTTCLNALFKTSASKELDKDGEPKKQSLSTLCGMVGNAVWNEVNMLAFLTQCGYGNPVFDKPKFYNQLERMPSCKKARYVHYHMEYLEWDWKDGKWNVDQRKALGLKLIEMCMKGSDYFKEDAGCVVFTEWFIKAWSKNESKMIEYAMDYKPMICPPKKWLNGQKGGYYGDSALKSRLVRLHGVDSKETKKYENKLKVLDLSTIYTALNAMQETAFKINPFTLSVLEEIVATGGDMCGVPRMEPIDVPVFDKAEWEALSEEERKRKTKIQRSLRQQENSRFGHALRFLMELKIAQKYAKYDNVYFPWNIDYRGRCYPMTPMLSPQGDDTAKGLLLFANAHEIQEDDWKWLAIHGANTAGQDKISFEERCEWIVSHTDDIIASVNDPLAYEWWYEVSKDDYPLEFLAFCNEWKNLQEYKKEHGCYAGFKTNLPVAFDGTCSGLQHFSALLRDEVGGYAVNLVPSDKVQDIYGIVAEKVNKVLLQDARTGTEDEYAREGKLTKAEKKQGMTEDDLPIRKDSKGKPVMKCGTKNLAQQWIVFNRMKFGQDGITRKVCKRSVMTLAYGSKQYGFKENLLADIIKPFNAEHSKDTPFLNPNQCAKYMARLIWTAVCNTVVKAVQGMHWLQDMSTLITRSQEKVAWLTPNNFLVQQNYMETKKEVKKLRFNGKRVRIYNDAETNVVDVLRQRNGIAPNFIHSLDATHLQRVVAKEYELGNRNFMMIHDSFGTDASRAGELYKTIRDEFVKMYKDHNYLQDFLDNVAYLIDDHDKKSIPEIPAFGTLDLDKVRESRYCFA